MNDNNIDWKDLEIGSPIEVFINKKYEIESATGYTAKFWIKCELTIQDIMDKMSKPDWFFRYRLKPLKSIRINKDLNDIIIHYIANTPGSFPKYSFCDGVLKMTDNRKVEIIGDDE